LIVAALATAPAFAQWPTAEKPKTETTKPTDTAAPSTPAPTPAPQQSRRARPSSAEQDDGSGFGFGLRGSWAFAYGGLDANNDVANTVNGILPLRLDAGYWLNHNLYLGAYFGYGFGFNNCLPGMACTSSDLNFGIEGIYNLMPGGGFQPWLGLGFGYEILNRNRGGDETTYKGLELANFELGADFAPSKNFSIGPYFSVPLFSKFSSFTANGQSNDIGSTVNHRWLQMGLKASFKL
jgi:hypothetical protein